MLKETLPALRKLHRLSQEALAEKVGVSRQAIAKWEAGDSEPTLEKARLLAAALEVTLDELTGEDVPIIPQRPVPKGKHLFGIVTVGDKGQIVIPARARRVFDIAPGDRLVVLGDEAQGIALVKAEGFLALAEAVRGQMKEK